jgi:hypothetical protein
MSHTLNDLERCRNSYLDVFGWSNPVLPFQSGKLANDSLVPHKQANDAIPRSRERDALFNIYPPRVGIQILNK